MTIRLFDVEAQKLYEQEMETYEVRAREASEVGSGVPWPKMPTRPEPTTDSRDPGLRPGSAYNCVPSGGYRYGSASDPSPTDPVDLDGNMQSGVEGYDKPEWQIGPMGSKPFTNTKKG